MFDTVFLRFQTTRTTRQAVFGLHFVAVPSFTATAFPCPGGLPLQHQQHQAAAAKHQYTMQHQHSTAAGRPCLTQFFYGFRRHVRHCLGSFLAPFRPSGPLCFPVRQGAFSASGGRAAAATGAAGGFYVSYVSLCNQWYKNWSKTIIFLGFQTTRQALFGLDSGAVPSFTATVFPCPAGCVFSLGRKSSSSNRSSRRVLCLIVQPVV